MIIRFGYYVNCSVDSVAELTTGLPRDILKICY